MPKVDGLPDHLQKALDEAGAYFEGPEWKAEKERMDRIVDETFNSPAAKAKIEKMDRDIKQALAKADFGALKNLK